MHRDDFELLKQDIIYFDSGATALKPRILAETISDYYNNYSANAHRGDYDISLRVDQEFENTRKLVADFIGSNTNEVIFTNNCTDALNKIVLGYFNNHVNENDEVLITLSEHASNVLPWFELAKRKNIKVNYIPLDDNHEVTMDNVIKSITDNTKVISIAHITNVIGDIRPIKEIIEYAHSKNILVVIDGAQSIPHTKMNVKELDIDFLAFSAHKMCGPTGVGVLYGKYDLLKEMQPLIVGGGMNGSFEACGDILYHEPPHFYEAGTPNIAGVIGFGNVIKYLNNIGIDNIHKYELELKEYAVKRLQEIEDIIIYNPNSKSGVIAFNMKDIFPQDLAIYLNKYHICVRAGNHCAKILKDEIGVKNTCRISLYFYNTKEEIDKLIEVLKNPNIKNEII
jgi:cysteine desulfurase/selenocysteine lyase